VTTHRGSWKEKNCGKEEGNQEEGDQEEGREEKGHEEEGRQEEDGQEEDGQEEDGQEEVNPRGFTAARFVQQAVEAASSWKSLLLFLCAHLQCDRAETAARRPSGSDEDFGVKPDMQMR
jgi:hypothetical protein